MFGDDRTTIHVQLLLLRVGPKTYKLDYQSFFDNSGAVRGGIKCIHLLNGHCLHKLRTINRTMLVQSC